HCQPRARIGVDEAEVGGHHRDGRTHRLGFARPPRLPSPPQQLMPALAAKRLLVVLKATGPVMGLVRVEVRIAVHRSTQRGKKKPREARPIGAGRVRRDQRGADQATATGILPILACQSFGPSMWALVPPLSTATVTGMSTTSNS